MNMRVQLEGVADEIAAGAVRCGLAKTKTDALLLGLVELDHHYKILERYEDELSFAVAKSVSSRIEAGKERVLSKKEFEKLAGVRI